MRTALVLSRRWWRRRPTARQVRIATGVVLLIYLTTHFINHSLGLISLDAMEAGRRVFLAVWRNPIGTIVLYGSLLIHFVFALQALYARRRLNLRTYEWAQLLLGLSVPFLLALHLFGTRVVHELYGIDDTYSYALLVYWVFKPLVAVQQTVLFTVAWLHGCIGLHYYLRLKSGYDRAFPYLYAVALLIPAFGLLGFVVGARTAAALAENQAWLDRVLARAGAPNDAALALVDNGPPVVWAILAAAIALVLVLRLVRRWNERRRGLIRITYPGNRKLEIASGPTILDISRLNDIPHASVCGGRGRCSTCRVRIVTGLDRLDPPQPAETAVLERVGAPPNVRLACQTRPTEDVEIVPLLPPNVGPRAGHGRPGYLQGREREIVILFADLRAFTQFAENKLPYDVVFLLNRYFRAMGTAVEDAGGHVDKFIGDGVMALFGIESRIEDASRQALAGARNMAVKLEELNEMLAGDLDAPLRIGIGIHAGAVIVGEMGYAHATALTAIGDAVNTASRLEAMTKELKGQLVVSQKVVDYAGLDLSAYPDHEAAIRGRRDPLRVRVVADAAKLPLT
jgi:adenylate cyclase